MIFEVEHACGHTHTWDNKWLDKPEHVNKFEAYRNYLRVMPCYDCYMEAQGIIPS